MALKRAPLTDIAGVADMDLDALIDQLIKPEVSPKLPFSLHFSEGTKYLRLRLFEKALDSLNTALEKNPSSVKALLMRSKANLRLQRYREAKNDAVAAMKLVPKYSETFALKGQAEYFLGDFEAGFLSYVRGREIRPDIDKLRLGQNLCREAIDNCMYKETGRKIDKQDIYLLAHVNDDGSRFERNSKNKLPTFERFSKDKKVLKELLMDDGLKSIHGICKDSLDLIDTHEKFWAMQKPLHIRRKVSFTKTRLVAAETVLKYTASMLKRCQQNFKRGLIEICITDIEKLLKIFDSRPDIPVSEISKLKADLFHLKGMAHLKQREETLHLECMEKELQMSSAYGDISQQIRAFHHLGAYYLEKRNFKEACRFFLVVKDILNSERLKKFIREQRERSSSGSLVHSNDRMIDIKKADVWARDFKENLNVLMSDGTADEMLLEIFLQEVATANVFEHEPSLVETNSTDTQYFSAKDLSLETSSSKIIDLESNVYH